MLVFCVPPAHSAIFLQLMSHLSLYANPRAGEASGHRTSGLFSVIRTTYFRTHPSIQDKNIYLHFNVTHTLQPIETGVTSMTMLFVFTALGLALFVLGLIALIWSIRSGQMDDLDTPAIRMLNDDAKPLKPLPPISTQLNQHVNPQRHPTPRS
jgi:cbb3-type cytochrome oxidase maturation protein